MVGSGSGWVWPESVCKAEKQTKPTQIDSRFATSRKREDLLKSVQTIPTVNKM